jgi:predicted phage terminase large subunit-like protein
VSPWSLKRIVVAIDFAVSIGADANETGLIVGGVNDNEEFFVIADLSGKYQPIEWATRAVGALRQYGADRIVAESNQGGAMIEATLRAVDRNVPVRLLHASRGKVTRAEPVAALFEQGRAHLAGVYPELEDQLATFEAGSPGSPDRLDAMVWAITGLMGSSGAVDHFGGIPNSSAYGRMMDPHGVFTKKESTIGLSNPLGLDRQMKMRRYVIDIPLF